MHHDTQLVATAIAEKRQIEIHYEPGLRLIEPHTLGYGSGGQVLLRAFQTEGASASGEHLHWKLMRLDRVIGMRLSDSTFDGPRPEYKRNDSIMKRGIIAQL